MAPFFGEKHGWVLLSCLLSLVACGDKAAEPATTPATPPPATASQAAKPVPPAPSGQAPTDAQKALTTSVRSALAGDATLSRRAIDITVTRGVARIWGTVASKAEIKRAGDLVGAVPGITSVENRLVVVQGS